MTTNPSGNQDWQAGLLEFTTVGFALKNFSGRILQANPAFCRLLGYTQDELIGMDYTKITHPADLAATHQILADLEAGLKVEDFWTKRYLRKDGTVLTARKKIARHPVLPGFCLVQIEDYTPEVARQDESTRQNDRLQAMLDSIPGMVGYWDSSLRNVFANRQYRDYFGRDPQTMQGIHIQDLLGPELYQKNLAYIEGALAGNVQSFERRLVTPEGVERYTVALYVPYLRHQAVDGFLAFVTDNSALKQAQVSKIQAESDLKTILDSATDFIIIATNPAGQIRLFSHGAEMLLGYSQSQMIGKAQATLFFDEDELLARELELSQAGHAATGFDALIYPVRSGKSERKAWTFLCQGGHRIPVTVVTSQVRDQNGQLGGFLFIARDATREQQAMDKLLKAMSQAEEANHAKSQFLANMSHEIRTPMNGVLGLAQLLLDSGLTPTQHDFASMIVTAGQSLLELINDILDLSKIEAGAMTCEQTGFALGGVLKAVANLIAFKAAEKGLEFAVNLPDNLPPAVLGDPLRLQQVLLNLLGNAVKFTPRGKVTLSVSAQAGQHWRFQVSDTGIGMDEAALGRLFKPFSQADGSISRQFGGTGLGLSISKQLAKMMGGDITVASRPGEGSTFCLELPLPAGQAPAAEDKPAEPADNLHGLRLLLVEDAKINQVVASAMLKAAGALVQIAENGQTAVDLVLKDPAAFDAILMDIQMPVMNGIEATRILKTDHGLACPVIALTAGALAEERDRCLAMGMAGFISKPFKKEDLLTAISQAVRQSGSAGGPGF